MSFPEDVAKLISQIKSAVIINQLELNDVVGCNAHLTEKNLPVLKLAAIKLFRHNEYADVEYNYYISTTLKPKPHTSQKYLDQALFKEGMECESCAHALLDVDKSFKNQFDTDNVVAILNSARDQKIVDKIKLRMKENESHKPVELNQPKGADIYRLRLPT